MRLAASPAVVDARLVLPDHWWRIPLQPAAARERSITALADRQFAGIDNQPQLHADLRKQLLTHAEAAADSDGRLLALCLMQVADIPVPASLVLHWIDVPADPDADPGDLLVGLQAELRAEIGVSTETGTRLDLARIAPGPVLRRVHQSAAELSGAEPAPSLVADYWLERPDGDGLVQLAFSTPMLPMREPLLELFDTIASTLRWVSADEQER